MFIHGTMETMIRKRKYSFQNGGRKHNGGILLVFFVLVLSICSLTHTQKAEDTQAKTVSNFNWSMWQLSMNHVAANKTLMRLNTCSSAGSTKALCHLS